jgi:apolipoprotein N-acyltransferase
VIANIGLALASAVLLILSFPRFNIAFLMTIAMAPLVLACAREPALIRRFLLGWITGAGCLFGITDWIRFVVSFHGGLGPVAGWAVFLLYCAAKGLYFGVFAALSGPVLRLKWALFAVPAVWVAVDQTAGTVLYRWVTLGNAGSDMSVPMRLAPLTGVHGLSFVFMMMSTAIVLLVLRRPRTQIAGLLVLVGLAFLPALPEPSRGTAQAVMVQPDVDQTLSWTSDSADALQRRLVMMSLEGALSVPKPELIVWPETPAPLYFDDDPRFRRHMQTLAATARVPVLFGTVARSPDGRPLNSAQLISDTGNPIGRYDKINLVPFGEYVPWPFTFAGKITSEVGDFRAGTRIVVAPVNGHQISAFICYESAFAGLVRSFAREGAEVLFNLSNDGYFGRSPSARGQHLLLVRMRAAENRRWILRGTNDGITAAVDPAGRVVRMLPSFEQVWSRMPFAFIQEKTIYTQFGDWFVWLCVLIAAPALLLGFQNRLVQ